ncbi:type II toxin-antitoxin system RelE/ParE family toxin [Chryseobacterium sp. MP_3.2]|uniref:type II toxin-antitoxin system RelE/ParE family toxin n=1 Tax=Chryseobacterium sp. MP_3.2 TaxID=3071712 RepID=UPI002E13CE2B
MERNKSKTYSKKRNKLFNECAEMILNCPEIGLEIPHIHCRKRLIRDFYFIYTLTEATIEIVTIWDTRQNPEKLQTIFGL